MAEFAWTMPLWPLLGWLALGALGGRLPRAAVSLIGCGTVAVAFGAAVVAWATLPESAATKVLFTWIAAGQFRVDVGWLLDPLSVVMALTVTGVGFLIHLYSVGYMAGDRA